MDFSNTRIHSSHGDGKFKPEDFKHLGTHVVIEDGVLVFHPETISIHQNVYIGHQTILKGYHKGEMIIGEGSWIGQGCFMHSAGNIIIGKAVGIGPHVRILTSYHTETYINLPVLHQPLAFGRVEICDGADIGIGTTILPNVRIGEGAIVGAGAVVTHDIEPFTVYAGVPAKFLRKRSGA